MKRVILMLSVCVVLTAMMARLDAQVLQGDVLAQQQAQAQSGNAKAQYEIAMRYLDGDRVPRDKEKAVYWLKKSAEQGYPDAEFRYSDYAPEQERLTWLRRAAEAGNSSAPLYLATALTEIGDDVNNLIEAIRWYEASDPSRARPIRNFLEDLSRQGLLEKLKSGDPAVQRTAAVLLIEKGGAITNNDKIARRLLARSAAQQDAKAAYLLGQISIDRGKKKEAEAEFLKAAQNGEPSAHVQLGILKLQRGEPILGGSHQEQVYYNRANYKEAIEHFQSAADAGVASGFFELGHLYEEGIPTPRVLTPQVRPAFKSDIAEAIRYYEKAARLRDPNAQAQLCLIYSGTGKPGDKTKNLIKAAMWALVLRSSDDPDKRAWGRQWLDRLANPNDNTQVGITTPELQKAEQAASEFLAAERSGAN